MLTAKNIHKVYNNGAKEIPVLRGVDLVIEKGGFTAIAGPSGAGKSTLLHILGGLDSPTQGKVLFDQQDFSLLNQGEICRLRNKRIGFVFQFYHLMPEFTVLENVLMPVLIGTGDRGQGSGVRERAMELLEQVGLAERVEHFPGQLSGGEKQRVAIVRGLINSPDLLLCDEPTGNLDSKTGGEIAYLIKKINFKNQMAVVLVTHNLEIAKMADKMYYLKDGVLVS